MNDYEDMVFVFDNKEDAQAVLDALNGQLVRRGVITVGDVYEVCDIPSKFGDHRRGWTETTDVKKSEVRNHARLVSLTFPPPQNIV